MDNFDLLFDKMNENYNYLHEIMGGVYEKIKENPGDESNYQLLDALGNLGKRMLSTQESLVESYCHTEEAASLIDRIDGKKEALTTSLEENTMGKRL